MSRLNYLGKHTTIAHLSQAEWKKIPFLKENEGLLPPFVIAVGDSRRVTRAAEVLNLKDKIALHEIGEKMLGTKGRGRVDILIGRYSAGKRSIPLVIVETQMGMPPTEIILREVLAHTSSSYRFSKGQVAVDGVYVIRVGTAGSINNKDGSGERIAVGDIVNAIFSIGWSGTLIESVAGLDYSSPHIIEIFKKKWIQMGHSFTTDGRYPLMNNAPELVAAINGAAKGKPLRVLCGGNFSKDSLYAEIGDELFMELRRNYNVISTEMEQMALGSVASEFAKNGVKVFTGLVSSIIGVLPGPSFAGDYKYKEKIEKGEEEALRIAADALLKVGTPNFKGV